MFRYFLSDAHLFPEPEEHPGRDRLVSFLKELAGADDPGEFWILGDLFDFWFEYRSVVPAGHERVLAALGELSRAGWNVHFLPGNHDFWVGRHFAAATGAEIHAERTVELTAGGMRLLLAHGDGLGPGDLGYRMLRPVLRSPLGMFLFRVLHPDLGTLLARKFSDTSRRILRRDLDSIPPGLGYWVDGMLGRGYDAVITGHTHLDAVIRKDRGIHVSLGDWLTRFTYCLLADGSDGPVLMSRD
ncbi:MAG: hypothetical protein AVO35_08140 [Candidatus Aegiribacteria sp. MLS_C]|nr:MAG: hypothetical protein AVO35_08140 [Candidatus Aegiribacteria sp. MLS_C]